MFAALVSLAASLAFSPPTDASTDASGGATGATESVQLPVPPEPEPVLAPDTDAPGKTDPVVGATQDADEADAKKGKPKVEFELAGRVMAGFEVVNERPAGGQPGEDELEQGFFLQQARFNAKLNYQKVLRVKLSIDLADAFRANRSVKYLRDAYGEARIHSMFRIRAGYFKRPFSRLELRGISKVPFRGRGLFNDYFIEDREWGDRAIGAMMYGKGEHLDWYVGAFRPGFSRDGVDTHGRLVWSITDWVAVGANGAYKRVTNDFDEKADVFAGGGDLRFKHEGLYISVESNAAQSWLAQSDRPWGVNVLGYISYRFELGEKTGLQPLVFAEWIDHDVARRQSEALRFVGGLNVLYTKHLRVMPQAEIVQPLAEVGPYNPWVAAQTYSLMLHFQM